MLFLTGEGMSLKKQIAKQAAAKSLLDKLAGRTIADEFYYNKTDVNNTVTNSLNDSFQRASNITSPSLFNNIKMGNFIGALQEFCDIKVMKHPKYEIESEENVAGRTRYGMACTLLDMSASGFSFSKKLAKQEAAKHMLRLFQQELISLIGQENYDEHLKA